MTFVPKLAPKRSSWLVGISLATAACSVFSPTVPLPKGNQNLNPQSGFWTVTVQDHPELSGKYEIDFITNQGPANVKIVTPSGATAQAPINWSSGNFNIYVTYSLADGSRISDEIQFAIDSNNQLAGVYNYNSTGVASTVSTLGVATSTTAEPSFSEPFTATYGAPSPAPTANAGATAAAAATAATKAATASAHPAAPASGATSTSK